MIVRSRGGDVALRGYGDYYDLTGKIPPPSIGTRMTGPQFGRVYPHEAVGVPAVLKAIREITETAAQLPCAVYRPDGEGSIKARDAWQWQLLHDEPAEGHFPFLFYAHLIASMLGHGGGLALKIRSRGRVWELKSMNPSRVEVCREGGEVRFKVREKNRARTKTLTREDVLYVPMVLLDDPEIGVSPLSAAAQSVRIGLGQQGFEERWLHTDGAPAEVITLSGNPSPEKRREFRESWEARHQPGTRRLGMLWGGATYEKIGLSLKDAEYAEAAQLTERRAKQIFNLPLDKEGDAEDKHFREITLQPVLTRIEQALKADRDIFPEADRELFAKFITAALLRPSLKDRADAYRLLRQGGIFTANECRVLEDMPEHEDGNELQATPVGGAPNPRRDGAAASDQSGSGRSDEEN